MENNKQLDIELTESGTINYAQTDDVGGCTGCCGNSCLGPKPRDVGEGAWNNCSNK